MMSDDKTESDPAGQFGQSGQAGRAGRAGTAHASGAVSYTHLTLPTILLV